MITTVQIKTLPSDYQQDFIMTASEANNFVDGFRSKNFQRCRDSNLGLLNKHASRVCYH